MERDLDDERSVATLLAHSRLVREPDGRLGGTDPTQYFDTGGRYDPSADVWTATSTVNAPSARAFHTAVWTGSQMMVWGGTDVTQDLNTGGIYDPAGNVWTATSTINVPKPRIYHTCVWSGSRAIVWAGVGDDGVWVNSGGRYDPST